MNPMNCRYCHTELNHTFVDLGLSPLANSYLKARDLQKMEPFYPLHTYVCPSCFLVQLALFETPSHFFDDYAYFSSYSESWLQHAQDYADMAVVRFGLTSGDSQVMEIASNDGYLLQYFQKHNIPVLGIEPAANVAAIAQDKGIPTIVEFFGVKLAEQLAMEGRKADLIAANNVLAHVPDLHDFVRGLKLVLKEHGVITIEFPHLMELIAKKQFDTIYHEHFSYFSLLTVKQIMASHGLRLFHVEQWPTHGGSLRIYMNHAEDSSRLISASVSSILEQEATAGLDRLETYLRFSDDIKQLKLDIIRYFLDTKQQGKTIVGYGAPAKGNTLLNYCGIGKDFVAYTVDRSPYKQNLYLPGTRIPILSPDEIKRSKPDYVLILPWNLKDEIMTQMSYIRAWGGQFIVMIPTIEVL
ncbi:methyltransferase [Paenibacillus sp. CCS19]|uniref:class I SAM-dependent methyltransferase n=1 Tax=Paenibacillus sp. CCS19 TaxID=3158387 RepID=UPI00256E9A20|nr:class I SAM-dependent methyltransferase [Paenibacillus cellulosilyticus]GMK41336.1 methyltransferase [Paenibacillus cellulosilyticus]